MNSQYNELIEAISKQENRNGIFEISGEDKTSFIANIQEKFVKGEPRVWWLSFKYRATNHYTKDDCQYQRIVEFFSDPSELCYFITELENLYLFKLPASSIANLISECSFFEYYVVNLDTNLLLCETDHGDFLSIDLRKYV